MGNMEITQVCGWKDSSGKYHDTLEAAQLANGNLLWYDFLKNVNSYLHANHSNIINQYAITNYISKHPEETKKFIEASYGYYNPKTLQDNGSTVN